MWGSQFFESWSDSARGALEGGARVVLIFVGTAAVRWIAHRAIGRAICRAKEQLGSSAFAATLARGVATSEAGTSGGSLRGAARLDTLASMVKSLASVIILTIGTLLVLGELHINLGPLLAGAGVAGIAIGFGAQSLVRDVLAGFFVMVEDQYGVGDIIDVGPATGTVERMSLRSTQLRDLSGTVWHVPNGSIVQVGNKSQNWARAVVEIVVSHDADLRAARAALRRVAAEMAAEAAWSGAMRVGGEADDQGVSALTPMGITLRLVVDTEPKSQWGVERELRMRIKEAFEADGIPLEVHQSSRPLS